MHISKFHIYSSLGDGELKFLKLYPKSILFLMVAALAFTFSIVQIGTIMGYFSKLTAGLLNMLHEESIFSGSDKKSYK